MGKVSTYPTIAGQHRLTHQPGGEDVIIGIAPGAHEVTHVAGGVDDIDSALDARALGLTAQGEMVFHAAAANTLATLAVGAAGDALLSGGVGANVSWGAPAPVAHEATHVAGGADDIDAALDARALAFANQGEIVFRAAAANTIAALATGVAGQALLTGGAGADPSWGAPAPAAHEATHVLGGADAIDSGLDARALNLTNQGEIVFRVAAANTLAALAVGVAGEALLSGGAAADISWGAPAPAAHESTHVRGGADDIDAALDARAIALTEQGSIVYHAAAATTLAELLHGAAGEALLSGGHAANPSWGAPTPAAHASTHESGGSDETRDIELDPGLADETGSGLLAIVTVGENVVTGDTLYMKADGKYWKSDADAAATMPAKVLVLDANIAADASGTVLHEGYYRNDDLYNWTLGNGVANLLFADVNPGLIVQFAGKPAGAGDQVQVVGWVVTANVIYWRPSLEIVEVA